MTYSHLRAAPVEITRMALRRIPDEPETRMFLKMIENAMMDSIFSDGHTRDSAITFLNSNHLDIICELIQLAPKYARELIVDNTIAIQLWREQTGKKGRR